MTARVVFCIFFCLDPSTHPSSLAFTTFYYVVVFDSIFLSPFLSLSERVSFSCLRVVKVLSTVIPTSLLVVEKR